MDDLESRIKMLEDGHKANRAGVRTSLAVLVFGAIVWGVPIAAVKWNNEEFEIKRDTTSPELVIIGGIVAASLFMGEKPIDLLRSIVSKK